MSNNKEPIDRK